MMCTKSGFRSETDYLDSKNDCERPFGARGESTGDNLDIQKTIGCIMTYLVRITRGKSQYFYECNSVRVKGKRNPVSERIYIGKLDLETREFKPKSYQVRGEADLDASVFKNRALPKVPRCHLTMGRIEG